ncbi:MAG: MlaD family protein, partial [Myxococcota bacterium]
MIGGAFVFVLGSQSNLFSSKTTYRAIFDDVGGLRPGNTVRIAGVSVGTVDDVAFQEDGTVEVAFTVVDSAASLIRGPLPEPVPEGESLVASQVEIGSKGMLGDRLLNIRPGSPSLPAWSEDEPVPVSASGDLFELAAEVGESAREAMANVNVATEALADPELSAGVLEVVGNLAVFTGMLANGEGAFQRILTDPETADKLELLLDDTRVMAREFRRASTAFRGIAEEVRSGDGSAHALIYGDEMRVLTANAGRAAGEAADALEAIRTGDGTMHRILFEDAGDELLSNVTEMSENFAAISADMRAGRGTVGGFLTDPSIYEDVKRLVGDLQRNDILRSLVRYSIRRDEAVEESVVEESEGGGNAIRVREGADVEA